MAFMSDSRFILTFSAFPIRQQSVLVADMFFYNA